MKSPGSFTYRLIVKGMSPFIRLYHRVDSFGVENLPPAGEPFILAPNHTNWFGWDALLISSILGDRDIRWLSWSYSDKFPLWDTQARMFNAILYNKKKKFPYEELAEEMRSGGTVVGIFPEGSNNPVAKWYRLRPFFPGCVRLSVMAGVPIVPVSVAGLEEASPIFWIKEEEGKSPTWLLAYPGLLPTKVRVRFGEPRFPHSDTVSLKNKEALYSEAKKVQLDVLELLKNDRPGAYAETYDCETVE